MKKVFCLVDSIQAFNKLKIASDELDETYTIGESSYIIFGQPDIKWNQIVFIENEKIIWTHGEFYNKQEIDLSNYITSDKLNAEINKIDLSKFLLKSEFEDSIDTSDLVTRGAVATINGQSIIQGGNIEIDSSIYKVVTTLPTENIHQDKIYLTKANTSTLSQTDFECWKYENNEWIDLGPFGSVQIDLSAYLSKTEADSRYMLKSSNSSTSLIVLNNGQVNNMGDNGQAFNAIRNVANASGTPYKGVTGSGFPLNCASFGVKTDGTTAFSHKKYEAYTVDKTTNTANAVGAKNTAVLVFSGKSGLMYAKNTGTAADVTTAMYKYVGVIDSPDENQRCYSAKQVDGIVDALTERIDDLENQNQYLMNVISILMNKVGVTPEELANDGTAQQSLNDINDDIDENINKNTTDYSDRSNEPTNNNDV